MDNTTASPPLQSRGIRIVRALLIVASALLILASAALGTYFGFESGSQKSFWIGVAFAIAALGGEVLKPFAVDAAFKAFARFRLGWGVLCTVTAIVCVLYSLAGELALSAGSRSDLVAKRQGQTEAAASAKSSRDSAQAELAEMAKSKQRTRSVEELEAIIARTPVQQPKTVQRKVVAPSNGAGCAAENGTGRWVCPGGRVTVQPVQQAQPVVHPLAAELGRAKRKAHLESVIAKNQPTQSAGHADPLATSLVQYLATLGYAIDLDVLSKWLYLVPVIFIETGSAFGIVVYRVFASEGSQRQKRNGRMFGWIRRSKPAEQSNSSASRHRSPVSAPELDEPAELSAPAAGPRPMTKLEAERCVVTQLALKRELPSQDWLADKCRVNKSTASEWLSDWECRGLIVRARVGRRKVIQAA